MQQNVVDSLHSLRSILETAFCTETACPNADMHNKPSSAGQCAAVAVIVWDRFGGEFVSTTAPGQSHWFNRLSINGEEIDVDLTGDQFGFPPVRFGQPGCLWANTRRRSTHELHHETIQRAALLAGKAGLTDTQNRLQLLLASSK